MSKKPKKMSWKIWRQCGKKVSFHTEGDANKMMEKIQVNPKAFKYKTDVSAYECPHCFCWHLTSKGILS